MRRHLYILLIRHWTPLEFCLAMAILCLAFVLTFFPDPVNGILFFCLIYAWKEMRYDEH